MTYQEKYEAKDKGRIARNIRIRLLQSMTNELQQLEGLTFPNACYLLRVDIRRLQELLDFPEVATA